MKEKLIDPEDLKKLHPVLQGRFGDRLVRLAMNFAGLNNANDIYDRSKHLTGSAFCTDLLNKLEITRTVRNAEIMETYGHRPFITVSNHPYGHIDGIAAIETVGSRTENYKMMVNALLGLIDTMSENFITVDPKKNAEKNKTTFAGIKESIAHVKSGKPLGFFPAGAVSNLVLKNGKFVIEDREWQQAVIKIIQKANAPVIPMHISGRSSIPFYASKIFGYQFKSLMLCHEFYNKRGKEMVITFGQPILPHELKQIPDSVQLGEFLKAKTYALGKK